MKRRHKPGLEQITATLRSLLQEITERYKVDSLGVFGSYVRRRENAASDLDILVSFRVVPSLIKFIELENYLADKLGVRVDLVMKEALKPGIGKRILEEVLVL